MKLWMILQALVKMFDYFWHLSLFGEFQPDPRGPNYGVVSSEHLDLLAQTLEN
jgi:hypothetical protein